jgi:hypothetical protein
MSYNLILNNTNAVGIYNTQFKYNFISGSFTINEDSHICISQIVLPYSFFNVNKTLYNNASMQYVWYYGAGLSQTYTVDIKDGFYSVSDLSNFLQQYMISQNQYFQNVNTGENEYFISISTNSTYYTNQIVCSSIPSTIPSGFIAPSQGFNYNNGTNYGFPTSGYNYTPQVIINDNNFGTLIGFSSGTYPSVSTQSSNSNLGDITPNLTTINSVVILCDLVKNECASPTNIMDSMTISNVDFGSNIIYQPSYEKWVSIQAGTYNSMNIQFVDQNFNIIQANDNNVMISLLLKQGDEKPMEIITTSNVDTSTIKPLSFVESS